MNDWSINMGIVGFLNILKHVDKEDDVLKKENYIEFDSSLLENFSTYYFKYFLYQDDMYKRISKNINMKVSYIKANPDKLKVKVEELKKYLSSQNEKVKKYFKDDSKIIAENLNYLKGIKKEEDIEELSRIVNNCLEVFKKDYVNEKLTINKSRNYISNVFFGQVSFLQKSRSSLTVVEQSKFMYRDYILPILDYCNLNELMDEGDVENLSIFIDKRLCEKNISKPIESIFKKIKKIIKKDNDIKSVLKYYNSDELKVCQMCTDHKGIISTYTEGQFAPLAVSSDNAMNMYWNMDTNFLICDVCKLMLFCTPAGATLVRKKYLQNEDNKFYSFVNLDTSLEDLYNKNISFRNYRDKENPFEELIIDIVSENEEKSRWQLENILLVEFISSIEPKMCKMNYFNMATYLAKFFCKETKTLNSIQDRNLKASTIDIILKEKDLKELIGLKLREKISDNINPIKLFYTSSTDIFKTIKIRYTLYCYKNGGSEKMDYSKLNTARRAGRDIHDYYVERKAENKLNGIAYRLLNTSKVRNKKDFMDIILRLFMSCEKPIVPTVFLDVMEEKELDFESIAYAFISGLISEKYEPKTKEGK